MTSISDPADPSSYPTLAIIVKDGDILIDKDVSQIDAILMAVNGKIMNKENEVSKTAITINGSMFGDVYDFFVNRQATGGDPRKDEGAVVIRFNQNNLLNPPPALSEFVNIRPQ